MAVARWIISCAVRLGSGMGIELRAMGSCLRVEDVALARSGLVTVQ
jgi:hypothetical protein